MNERDMKILSKDCQGSAYFHQSNKDAFISM